MAKIKEPTLASRLLLELEKVWFYLCPIFLPILLTHKVIICALECNYFPHSRLIPVEGSSFLEINFHKDGETPLNFKQHDRSVHSVIQSCLTLCDSMDCRTSGFPIHHQLLEFAQTHVHWVSEAIQPSHPQSNPSPPAFNLYQHQGIFKWVSSSHQVAKGLELQLQHQSFPWIFKTDFL